MHECFACHLALQPVVQSRGGRKLQVVRACGPCAGCCCRPTAARSSRSGSQGRHVTRRALGLRCRGRQGAAPHAGRVVAPWSQYPVGPVQQVPPWGGDVASLNCRKCVLRGSPVLSLQSLLTHLSQ